MCLIVFIPIALSSVPISKMELTTTTLIFSYILAFVLLKTITVLQLKRKESSKTVKLYLI